ncbi:SAM-dependent methyltransferase [Labilibaculum filiforme]|uniref:SAM-dependent methyltransferase n=1 Tax=Labilibaculum filiforme TaxID=1940526 RepID=A0A2N3HVH3_9BACT|nr:class I SAM-dependent methyltransferase [Labilibaculum filiforme]PKQ62052.1 SAM-dependent methyltransferase [Labilibaculum filiforme]
MNKKNSFDEYASAYDSWFFDNTNLLQSEVNLVAHFLKNAGKVFSVGCGSGLFESILKKDFNIEIKNGIEPSLGMAEIARKRGMSVEVITSEDAEFGIEQYDTVLFNGTPSYITDLECVINKAYASVKKGGKLVMIDVPKESSYATMYNLAKAVDTWEHPLLEGINPKDPYPIEFVRIANWRTTQEKVELLEKAGFKKFEFAQTLTKHPLYSNNEIEQPIEGYDSGDYVAICAIKY